MKKFIVKLVLFILLLCSCDLALGYAFRLYDYTNRGEIHKTHNVITMVTPEMLVLGSSRANHHYDSHLIGDSLGISVYNAGFNGKGTTISYGLLLGIAQREYPKYILCEMTPDYDIYDENGTARGLEYFYPYSNVPGIYEMITDFDSNEKWKLLSNSYRLNSALLRLVPSIFSQNDDNSCGFDPMDGTINTKKLDLKPNNKVSKKKIHPIKEKYLRKLIQDAKANECEIIFAISPVYGGRDIASYEDELDIVNDYNIRVLNHLNDTSIINNKDYFSDVVHLNKEGARAYSKIIASELSGIIPSK